VSDTKRKPKTDKPKLKHKRPPPGSEFDTIDWETEEDGELWQCPRCKVWNVSGEAIVVSDKKSGERVILAFSDIKAGDGEIRCGLCGVARKGMVV